MFVVLYRWKVKPEKGEEFREGWRLVTTAIQERDGSLGARLHQVDDNIWVAYAQWPDRESWDSAWQKGPVDEALGYHLMKGALRRNAQSEKPFLTMKLTDDCFSSLNWDQVLHRAASTTKEGA